MRQLFAPAWNSDDPDPIALKTITHTWFLDILERCMAKLVDTRQAD